jgi:phospholipid/cholesterol/gamma-HCH transport system substrate-binding protein
VAIFVLVTLAALLVMTLTLGRSRQVLAKNVTLHTSFENVAGLVRGTQVRLAGVNVGIVSAIRFSEDARTARRVFVDLTVRERDLHLIRADSVAMMSSKGLLGDNVVDVTLGSQDQPQLKDGDYIQSSEAVSITSAMDQVNRSLAKLERFVDAADERLRLFLTPELAANFNRIGQSTASLLEEAQHGDGLAHQLLYDPALAKDAQSALRDTRTLADRLSNASNDLERVLAEVQQGDGVLHGLVYGEGGPATLKDLQATLRDVSHVTQELRSGNGIAHTLIYEDAGQNLVRDLSDAARIVRRLAVQTEQGKGTLGGLLKDPTAYEDLTTVFGNIKRNTLLKAVIRFTIRNDNLKRSESLRAQQPVPEEQPVPTEPSPTRTGAPTGTGGSGTTSPK